MNNIGIISQKYEQQTYLDETADKQRISAQDNKPIEKSTDVVKDDKVSLSQTSKDMQLAKQASADAPDIREDRVAQLKQDIADGQYEINPEKIAEKLVGTIISEVM